MLNLHSYRFLLNLACWGLAITLLCLAPAQAQNTKGDQPVRQPRETRITSGKGAGEKLKNLTRRIFPSRKSPAVRSRSAMPSGRVGAGYRRKQLAEEKAWIGNAAGNRISVRTATGQTRNVYPQRGRFVHNPSARPADAQQRWRAVKASRITVRSATGRTRNVYPQTGRYVHNPSRSPGRVTQRVYPNQTIIARNLSSASLDKPPGRKKRVVPTSASRAYIARKSINPYAGFWNRKQKGERAYVGDISGRRLRTKNYEIARPGLVKPSTTPYYGRKRLGDRPYKGPASGGYVSATRSARAWQGDIAGRRIRGRNFSSKRTMEQVGRPVNMPPQVRARGDQPYRGKIPGGGYKTATRSEKRVYTSPLPPRAPGMGAKGIDNWSGSMRVRRGFGEQGLGFAGIFKARKPQKGGGSVSGQLWNNRGQPVPGKTPGIGARRIDTWSGNIRGRKAFSDQGEGYAGAIKARRPQKGGGSVSGQLWNNRGQPVPGKTPGIGARRIDTWSGNIRGRKAFSDQGEGYAGAIKARKPQKGGGSISGQLWNNNQQPIQGKIPVEMPGNFPGKYRLFDLKPSLRDQGEEYTGALKARRPKKGGGSVSGRLWNNNQQPIPVRTPDESAARAARYSGNQKVQKKEYDKSISRFTGNYHLFDLRPDMRDQGEEFTGFTRLARFKRNYIKNPNQAEDAIKKQRPDKTTYAVQGLQVRLRQQHYADKENAVKEALPGIAPGRMAVKASEFNKAMKREWDYRHNPSSARAALEVREPGKAFGRLADYQGNIRMRKFEFFGKKELHPDARFVKINKNNVKEEKDLLTSLKLWWDKTFRKEETQPNHLKERVRKPRFDKREIGLWYD